MPRQDLLLESQQMSPLPYAPSCDTAYTCGACIYTLTCRFMSPSRSAMAGYGRPFSADSLLLSRIVMVRRLLLLAWASSAFVDGPLVCRTHHSIHLNLASLLDAKSFPPTLSLSLLRCSSIDRHRITISTLALRCHSPSSKPFSDRVSDTPSAVCSDPHCASQTAYDLCICFSLLLLTTRGLGAVGVSDRCLT